MSPHDRKPLAKLESKDDRIAFRIAPSLKGALMAAAFEEVDDFSTYCRACLLMGHTMKQSQKLLKATVG